uniref:Uncharacterized protein n=1 Tax=Panagrolaimus sp. ES5 TaxID=591445 RepID=A0AC34GGH2_9BILA
MENIISPQTTSTSSPAVNDQLPPPCSTCVKYHESIKDSISQLDQKMNLILSKMEEIISTTTVSAATKQQTVTDAIGSGPSKSSTSLSPQHDATRSATEDDEGTDLIYPTKKNGNFNG